jgi:RNA polymerase II-associated protein 1
LIHTGRPVAHIYIGPTFLTPQSISLASTQRLPSNLTMTTGSSRDLDLPLTSDWVFSPLAYPLQSATSTLFKSMPSSWDASETEVVRASLLLAKVVCKLLKRYALHDFVISREETVFGCMKVFMLEHELPQNGSVE